MVWKKIKKKNGKRRVKKKIKEKNGFMEIRRKVRKIEENVIGMDWRKRKECGKKNGKKKRDWKKVEGRIIFKRKI